MSQTERLSPAMNARLSVMMFLQYAAPGLWLPILSHLLLNRRGFEAFQAGQIMACRRSPTPPFTASPLRRLQPGLLAGRAPRGERSRERSPPSICAA